MEVPVPQERQVDAIKLLTAVVVREIVWVVLAASSTELTAPMGVV